MSRKQAVKARPGKAEAERKRDERAARRALAKEKRNRPEGEEGGLAGQLQALGLRLREVPGDGNCLFRALGDQLEGHSRNHLKYRQETVDYMIKRREDFEPFVEDDVPFEKHVANLAQPGTFAGNDAIVAFARNNQVNVVIHQLNAPLWQIRGTDKGNAGELHIAYRYGEHYDSVRKINDNAEAPARLQTEMLSRKESSKKEKIQLKGKEAEPEEDMQDEIEDAVQKVRNATGCMDSDLIAQILETEDYNIDSAIFAVSQVNEVQRLHAEEVQATQANRQKQHPRPAAWEENGSGARIFGSQEVENNKSPRSPVEGNQGSKKQQAQKQMSSKQKKEQQRLEKKRRQEDRHRQKVLAGKDNNKNEPEPESQVTLVKTVAALNI